MYLLGCVTAWLTLPDRPKAHLYTNLYPELFFDVSCLAILLWAVGRHVRPFLKGLFYVIAYTVALVDVYCFVKYDTTLTPTVMMLLSETDTREAGEFIQTIFSWDLITGKLGYILLIIIGHILISSLSRRVKRGIGVTLVPSVEAVIQALFGALMAVLFVYCGIRSFSNKQGVWRLLTARDIGKVEHILTEKDHGEMYQPLYRLAFSARANALTAEQIVRLKHVTETLEVDSCSFTSPYIVLIIGESYSRHHSQLYGYWQKTTPRQVELEKSGNLVKFSDVVCPWNLTSFVFKQMFSTYVVGDSLEWCDYPLFPELFRKAGYHVTFLTNQFLPKAKEAVYDFSGGFFLNDPELSEAQFDARNSSLHQFDEDLLTDYKYLAPYDSVNGELAIFHLVGQHVAYSQRSPKDRKIFKKEEYAERKPHLSDRERRILSYYDNAVLYNDSVVDAIARHFDDKEAIVIYVPDHGEECYEGDLHFFCRMHSTEITSRLAHAEFDIPFWIYFTDRYQEMHPDICEAIRAAKDRKYMTDALPHLLLYLAGIHCNEYRSQYNILGEDYLEDRPRLLKNTTDYDALK